MDELAEVSDDFLRKILASLGPSSTTTACNVARVLHMRGLNSVLPGHERYDPLTLYRHCISHNKNSALAYCCLSILLGQLNQPADDATGIPRKDLLLKAVELKPDFAEALTYLANLSPIDEKGKLLAKSIRIDSTFPQTIDYLSTVVWKLPNAVQLSAPQWASKNPIETWRFLEALSNDGPPPLLPNNVTFLDLSSTYREYLVCLVL